MRVDSIFYLLNVQERRLIIEKVLRDKMQVDLAEFIILLSPPERMRFLDGLMYKKHDMIEIMHLLSQLEKRKYNLSN